MTLLDVEMGAAATRRTPDAQPGHAPRSPSISPRESLRRVAELVGAHPDLGPRYEAAKAIIRAFRKPAFYEVSQRCNLFCEGCYYFESERRHDAVEPQAVEAWEAFFASEAQRHVSMAYFVGAEPALHQERLIAASKYFPHGNIGTNGTVRIDPEVPYRIAVSVWAGDEATDRKLRGASVFLKGLRNYQGDPRAIVLFTLSPWNLAGVRTVAEMCREHGLPLTFNMYSPTSSFLDRLSRGEGNDDQYFRVSRPGSTPCFSDEDLAQTRRTVEDLMEAFEDTIIYSRPYNDWVTRPGPLHEIDPQTGLAPHCGSRAVGTMRYYTADQKPSQIKCCTPDFDCADCRMYSGGWSTRLQPSADDLAGGAAFSAWLEMIGTIGRIFVHDRVTAPPRPAARAGAA